jgi:hypothetical protein
MLRQKKLSIELKGKEFDFDVTYRCSDLSTDIVQVYSYTTKKYIDPKLEMVYEAIMDKLDSCIEEPSDFDNGYEWE